MSSLAANPAGEPANFLVRSSASHLTSALADASTVRRNRRPIAEISATILTRNSEALLGDVLRALDWCDEVVVLDTGSTDATLAIAEQFPNVSVHRLDAPFPGFGRAHRKAVDLARHDWILSVDSDEIVSPELRDEIAALPLDPGTVYTIPFDNFFNGKRITTCGWAPDRHERLFHRRTTNFCTSEVHERVITTDLDVVHLREPIRHYSYRSSQDFLRKMSAYAQLFATQHAGRRRSSPFKAVSRAAWAFVKSYILERGILQGSEGFVISTYKAQTVFWKYTLLHEANVRLRLRPAPDTTGESRTCAERHLGCASAHR